MTEKIADTIGKSPLLILVLLLVFSGGGFGVAKWTNSNNGDETRIAVLEERILQLSEMRSEIAKIGIIIERQDVMKKDMEYLKQRIDELKQLMRTAVMPMAIKPFCSVSDDGEMWKMPSRN